METKQGGVDRELSQGEEEVGVRKMKEKTGQRD